MWKKRTFFQQKQTTTTTIFQRTERKFQGMILQHLKARASSTKLPLQPAWVEHQWRGLSLWLQAKGQTGMC